MLFSEDCSHITSIKLGQAGIAAVKIFNSLWTVDCSVISPYGKKIQRTRGSEVNPTNCQEMGEERSCGNDRLGSSDVLETKSGVGNVNELLRMLEAAVENEFVGMKKAFQGLGGNSENMEWSKSEETSSSSSAGTPTSMYSACGSVFSRSSVTKEKSSQEDDVCRISHEANESQWCGRHEALQIKVQTTLKRTTQNEIGEEAVEYISDRSQDISLDQTLNQMTSISEDSSVVEDGAGVSTPEEILENFHCMIHEMMALDTNHISSQRTVDFEIPWSNVVLDHLWTDDKIMTQRDSVKQGKAVDCGAKDFGLECRETPGADYSSISSMKNVQELVSCSPETIGSVGTDCEVSGSSCNIKNAEGLSLVSKEVYLDLSEGGPSAMAPDGSTSRLGAVMEVKDASFALVQESGPDTAFSVSTKNVGIYSIQDVLLSDFTRRAKTSLLEAVKPLECQATNMSPGKDGKKNEGPLEAIHYEGESEALCCTVGRLSQSTIEESQEAGNSCDSDCKLLEYASSTLVSTSAERQKQSIAEVRHGKSSTSANGEEAEGMQNLQGNVHLTDSAEDLWSFRGLEGKNVSAQEGLEDTSYQLIDEIVRRCQLNLEPDDFEKELDKKSVQSLDQARDRSVTSRRYSQEHGGDDIRLVKDSSRVQDESRSREGEEDYESQREFQECELEMKNSMSVVDVIRITDQAREASSRTSKYYSRFQENVLHDTGMRDGKEHIQSTRTSKAERGHLSDGDHVGAAAVYLAGSDHKLFENDAVEYSSCCTPTWAIRGLKASTRSCCVEGAVERASSSGPLHCVEIDHCNFSTATLMQLGEEAAPSIPGARRRTDQGTDWRKPERRSLRHPYDGSTQSTSMTTCFGQLLNYGCSVKNKRNMQSSPSSHPITKSPSVFSAGGDVLKKPHFYAPTSLFSKGCNPSAMGNQREKVKVVVRMRPFAEHEKVSPLRHILCISEDKVIVKDNNSVLQKAGCPRSKEFREVQSLEFKLDKVVDDSFLQNHRWDKKAESQRRMYELIALPCLEYAFDGYNTTIMTYGQVGSGKTYTMMGDDSDEGRGIMPRLAEELMHQITTEFKDVVVQVSYLEIYRERIRDLLDSKLDTQTSRAEAQVGIDKGASRCGSVLNDRIWLDDSIDEELMASDTASHMSFGAGTPTSWKDRPAQSICFDTPTRKKESLRVREHPVTGPYVEGLLWKELPAWKDMKQSMLEGAARRTLETTAHNKNSSRGHTLFSIKLVKNGKRPNVCVINMVDLAGTEKSKLARRISLERLNDSRHINRSIAHLNDVILNLSKNSNFVPYRSSSLTWLLRDSLGGNTKTFLIANLSPAEQDFQESVNTLRYAAKASHIQSSMISGPDRRKQPFVTMKEMQILHDMIRNLTPQDDTQRQEQDARGSCFPVLTSFELPRLNIPIRLNTDAINWA